MSMRQYTRELYARLEAETGLATGFTPVGFIEVAADEGRLEEYRRVAAFNRHVGLDVHEITPREIAERFPLAETSDLLAGFYVPQDGRVNPVDATMSLAKGARMQGVSIIEGVSVEQVLTKGSRVTGVRTSEGDIECEYVVNCAGMWARQLGERNGVVIPLQAAEHYYLITEPIDGVDPAWPVLEDPSRHGYYREEGGGLMVGLFEPVCAPWNVDAIPSDFSFGEITPDWDRMGPYVERAMSRVPITLEAGIRTFFCGPESFTPDLAPIVGEAPGLDNYFVAAGMNSVGILTGGGMGRIVAQWIVDGRPDVDVTGFTIDRMQDYQLNPRYRAERTVETLGMVYQTHFPGRSMQTARGVKRSPVHDRLVEQRACFRDVSGWEGADWYAPAGVEPRVEELSWGRQNWFPYWADEHRAVREGVGLMDMSFMSKFLVQGSRRRPRARPSLGQRRRRRAGCHHLHAVAQRGRHAGGRPHGDQARGRQVPRRRVGQRPRPRAGVAAPSYRGRPRLRHGRHVRTGPAQRARPSLTRAAAVDHLGRPVERGVPVPCGALHRRGLRAGPVRAHHLPRGARLRAVRSGRAGDARVRAGGGGGRGVRPAAHGAEGAGEPADGEGLPRLRARHRQHRHGARGGTRIRGGVRQAGRLRRARRRAGAEGRRPAHPPPRAGAPARPGAADAPRRGGPPRRGGRRLRTGGELRPHPRWRGRARDARCAGAVDGRLARLGRLAGRRGGGARARGGRRCGRCTTRTTCASAPDPVLGARAGVRRPGGR